jgi:ABC-2 type transport system permease protein
VKAADLQAIYVMWIRQMKKFVRSKSRIVVTIVQPLFFLFILGSGFSSIKMPGLNEDIEFIHFFAPGIVAMSILFSSMFAGISVLWDKQFGFLQEVLVAPVSRISIIVGRTLGGATTAIIQGFIILIIAIAIGTPISGVIGFILTIIFMILIAFSAVGFGLILASKMQDFQSFPIIINLIIMPLLFLSSAFFPVAENKTLLTIAYFNPIFYMVDGLRGSMIGLDNSVIQNPLISIVIVLIICILMLFLGSYLFSKSEA